MTTVIIDFKNKKVVADKQITSTKVQSNILSTEVRHWTTQPSATTKHKIIQNEDGSINRVLVGAGNWDEVVRQFRYNKNTGFIDKPKGDCTIAIVYEKGDGLLVDLYNAVKTWYGYKWEKSITQGNSEVITFGSGGNFAYGAFMGGLSAEDSIVAASKCDKYTSCEYDVVELGEII